MLVKEQGSGAFTSVFGYKLLAHNDYVNPFPVEIKCPLALLHILLRSRKESWRAVMEVPGFKLSKHAQN